MEIHFRWQKLKTCWNSRWFHKSLLINDTLRHDYTDIYSIQVQYIFMYVSVCMYRVLSCNSQLVLQVSSAASSSAAAVTQFVAHFWVRLNDLLRECALYVRVCAGVVVCVCVQVFKRVFVCSSGCLSLCPACAFIIDNLLNLFLHLVDILMTTARWDRPRKFHTRLYSHLFHTHTHTRIHPCHSECTYTYIYIIRTLLWSLTANHLAIFRFMNEFQFARTCRMNNGNHTATHAHTHTHTVTHTHSHTHSLAIRVQLCKFCIWFWTDNRTIALSETHFNNLAELTYICYISLLYIILYYIFFVFANLCSKFCLVKSKHCQSFRLFLGIPWASVSNWNTLSSQFVWNLLELCDSNRHIHTHRQQLWDLHFVRLIMRSSDVIRDRDREREKGVRTAEGRATCYLCK